MINADCLSFLARYWPWSMFQLSGFYWRLPACGCMTQSESTLFELRSRFWVQVSQNCAGDLSLSMDLELGIRVVPNCCDVSACEEPGRSGA